MQADDNCERKKKVAHIRHHLEDDGGEESGIPSGLWSGNMERCQAAVHFALLYLFKCLHIKTPTTKVNS